MAPADGTNLFLFYRGRVALSLILQGLGVQAGDEVILQAFTCLAVPDPIVRLGATPVYADIDRHSFNANPQHLASLISPRTRAIIVQHTYGIPAEMDPILETARRHRLPVIEDCCHLLGSTYRGKPLGAFGEAAFYSYEWGKPVVAGIGGSAVVRSPDLQAEVARRYRDFRRPPLTNTLLVHLQYAAFSLLRRPALFWPVRDFYQALVRTGLAIGNFARAEADGGEEYGWRMASSIARRLQTKLDHAAHTIDRRRRLAAIYESGLKELSVELPRPPEGGETVFLCYPLLTTRKADVLEAARKSRVELGDWFASPVDPLGEDQWARVGYKKGTCPVAEEVARSVVTLPLYAGVRESDTQRALDFLRNLRTRGLV